MKFRGYKKSDSLISGGKAAKKGAELGRKIDPTKVISPEEYKKQCAIRKAIENKKTNGELP